jgi:hypothetical protein
MVARRVWDNAINDLQMVLVAAPTTRSSMSALGLHLEFVARTLGIAVLTLSTVVLRIVRGRSDHVWHRARMERVLGIEVCFTHFLYQFV